MKTLKYIITVIAGCLLCILIGHILTSCGSSMSDSEIKQKYKEVQKKEAAEKASQKRYQSGQISFDDAINKLLSDKDDEFYNNKPHTPHTYKFYDGHHYYKFFVYTLCQGYDGYGLTGITHDPDCELHDIEVLLNKSRTK